MTLSYGRVNKLSNTAESPESLALLISELLFIFLEIKLMNVNGEDYDLFIILILHFKVIIVVVG
ncbi:hypothetical protein QTP88_022489 [Uroleucon formosanum]